jgi:hypothetical protein
MREPETYPPCLVLAPHLIYPLRDGGNILIQRRWSEFSRHSPYVDILGCSTWRRYQAGKLAAERSFHNKFRSKPISALRTLIFRSHYLKEKFLTPEYIRQAMASLTNDDYRIIVYSLISTAELSLLPQRSSRPHRWELIETQNDEVAWYNNLKQASRNPLAKKSSEQSKQWIVDFLHSHGSRFIFLHVTEKDYDGYSAILPAQNAIVAPAGADLCPPPSMMHKSLEQGIRLLFIGSLSVQMNYDALVFFRDRFFPPLKQAFGGKLDVVVAGSNPTTQVIQLCERMQWKLHANISDDELHQLYYQASFSILPFPYSTGAKLKLFGSLAHATPFLSTTNMGQQVDSIPETCLLSDEPMAWLRHIQKRRESGISVLEQKNMLEFSRQYSWASIADRLAKQLLEFRS